MGPWLVVETPMPHTSGLGLGTTQGIGLEHPPLQLLSAFWSVFLSPGRPCMPRNPPWSTGSRLASWLGTLPSHQLLHQRHRLRSGSWFYTQLLLQSSSYLLKLEPLLVSFHIFLKDLLWNFTPSCHHVVGLVVLELFSLSAF